MDVRIGLVAASDRASSGQYADRGIPALRDYLATVIASNYSVVEHLVPDDQMTIASTLIDLVDNQGCCLVLVTGGTGPSPRDVTPEAASSVFERMLPGFGEVMRRVSYGIVPTAILSRQGAGTRGSCLIITLPGKPTAIAECLDAVVAAIPDCIDLIGGPRIELSESIGTYRPHDS